MPPLDKIYTCRAASKTESTSLDLQLTSQVFAHAKHLIFIWREKEQMKKKITAWLCASASLYFSTLACSILAGFVLFHLINWNRKIVCFVCCCSKSSALPCTFIFNIFYWSPFNQAEIFNANSQSVLLTNCRGAFAHLLVIWWFYLCFAFIAVWTRKNSNNKLPANYFTFTFISQR